MVFGILVGCLNQAVVILSYVEAIGRWVWGGVASLLQRVLGSEVFLNVLSPAGLSVEVGSLPSTLLISVVYLPSADLDASE